MSLVKVHILQQWLTGLLYKDFIKLFSITSPWLFTVYTLSLSHPSHHPSFNPLPHLSHKPLRPWASTWLKSSFRAEPPPSQIRQCVCLFVCYPCTIVFRCRNVCHWVLVSMECQTWHLKTAFMLGYCTLLCTERLNKTLYMFLKIRYEIKFQF